MQFNIMSICIKIKIHTLGQVLNALKGVALNNAFV
jgi:hypothetical protein